MELHLGVQFLILILVLLIGGLIGHMVAVIMTKQENKRWDYLIAQLDKELL